MTDAEPIPRPIIRAASILLEDGRICLVKQKVTETRNWSLPGGKLELREKLSECISREFKEETGLDVDVMELLYVTDRITSDPDTHVVHMSFRIDRSGTETIPVEWTHTDPYPSTSSGIVREIKMVPVNELQDYGFSQVFCRLVKEDFPKRGSYMGDYFTFYNE